MRPCQLRSTGHETGVSPGRRGGLAARRLSPTILTPRAAKSISPPPKWPGLYFRHCPPYIGPWAAAAKGDREDDQGLGARDFRSMLNDIYNKRIIELAGNIPRLGRLAKPDASATAHSKLCGSTVKIDLKMDGPVVTDFAHDVKACALGQASSSIMARHVIGSNASELRELRETVRKMLKENGAPPPPDHKWADI